MTHDFHNIPTFHAFLVLRTCLFPVRYVPSVLFIHFRISDGMCIFRLSTVIDCSIVIWPMGYGAFLWRLDVEFVDNHD